MTQSSDTNITEICCLNRLWGFKSLPAHYAEVVKCNNDTVLEGESLWSSGENIQIRSKIATWFCINMPVYSRKLATRASRHRPQCLGSLQNSECRWNPELNRNISELIIGYVTERFRGSTHDGTNLNTVKEVISQNVAVAQLVFRASV